MAQLTRTEFNEAVAALAEHYGVERLRDHLATHGAFTSRRGLNTRGRHRRPAASPVRRPPPPGARHVRLLARCGAR